VGVVVGFLLIVNCFGALVTRGLNVLCFGCGCVVLVCELV